MSVPTTVGACHTLKEVLVKGATTELSARSVKYCEDAPLLKRAESTTRLWGPKFDIVNALALESPTITGSICRSIALSDIIAVSALTIMLAVAVFRVSLGSLLYIFKSAVPT